MARLPFSPTRLEGRDINLRSSKLPVRFDHPVREIGDHMDDIVYNAIDVIQEKARDNELRTFYFNLMSDDDYRNKDFEKIIGIIADIIDIGVTEGKFRDVRDAVVPVVEDVLLLHIGYMVDEYPELLEFIGRAQERDIDRAISQFETYLKAVDVYRRNGNKLPQRGRGRDDRDDRFERDRPRDRDRDRGSDRGVNYGGERDAPRRDRWERGALRGGVQGSPRRTTVARDNRFGNSDQSDRFDDHTPGQDNNRQDQRDDRNDRNDTRQERSTRFEDAPSRVTRRDDDQPRSLVQHLPGHNRATSDIDDALAREATNQGSATMKHEPKQPGEFDLSDTTNPVILASQNLDAWIPSLEFPHPLVINKRQDLYYEMDITNGNVVPRAVPKDQIVNYYEHGTMAFGSLPKDSTRFDDDGKLFSRINKIHNALNQPTEDFGVAGSDEVVTYRSRMELDQTFIGYSLKELMNRLNYHRLSLERSQPNADSFYSVDLGVGKAVLVESFAATVDECGLLEEMRQITSFTKLCEKMRYYSKNIRTELFLQLDKYLTEAVNRMMRQNLSIPTTRITSFTSDWLELFAWITEKYGDGYRDAILTNQEKEIGNLLGYDNEAETLVTMQIPEANIRPFLVTTKVKLFYVNEVSHNLDVDMVPDVASQLLPELNPFFHDMAQDLLTKNADEFGRFYIQTSDNRLIEASRSYLNDKAILLRVLS